MSIALFICMFSIQFCYIFYWTFWNKDITLSYNLRASASRTTSNSEQTWIVKSESLLILEGQVPVSDPLSHVFSFFLHFLVLDSPLFLSLFDGLLPQSFVLSRLFFVHRLLITTHRRDLAYKTQFKNSSSIPPLKLATRNWPMFLNLTEILLTKLSEGFKVC